MTRIRLKHVNAFHDRHGRLRHYFRKPGCKCVALTGLPGSAEFMDAYQAAVSGQTAPSKEIGSRRTKPGTIAALTAAYFSSLAFQRGAPETRRTRRNILERFRAKHGDKPIALLQRRHIEEMVAAKAGTPSSARNFLNTIRAMLQFAVEAGIRPDNPAVEVKRVIIKTGGYRTWTEDDITAFEATHQVGSRPRLALALLLYTGQRRSDVIKMGRQHIRNGIISFKQQKTGRALTIPVHPTLQAVLDVTPSEHLTFLTTRGGSPFSAAEPRPGQNRRGTTQPQPGRGGSVRQRYSHARPGTVAGAVFAAVTGEPMGWPVAAFFALLVIIPSNPVY